ncbi:zinc finger protein 592 isoform X3 [Varanus komodoensis]|uniref:zinc finger protein 592 isoform X3 n=1 Tax=Varanus komodoensis TaxID=61221 RepID=UPI001CF7B01B|nr:zinc finger protein 592 isoform X3 [Varanus komodoensis]
MIELRLGLGAHDFEPQTAAYHLTAQSYLHSLEVFIMGDMKTPDFDDLLAAFDIPDPTSLDAKEAIQTAGEENENHLKPPGICPDENASLAHAVPASDVPVVSVIVKNTCRQESFEAEKEGNHVGPGLLHNGFRGSDLPVETHNYGKFDSAFINGDGLRNYPEKLEQSKSEPLPTFSQFSPISSPEPEDALKENSVVDKSKQAQTSYFPPHPMYIPSGSSVLDLLSRTLPEPEFSRFMSTGPSLLDLLSKKLPEPELSMFDQYCKKDPKIDAHGLQESRVDTSRRERDKSPEARQASSKDVADTNSFLGEGVPLGNFHSNNLAEGKGAVPEMSFSPLSIPPRQRIKPAHSKLSSCVAALVALQAKKVAGISKEEQASVMKEPPGPFKDGVKGSPKMPKSPKSPRSPLEIVRKATKQPESPRSVCSDSSSKGSPSVATGSPPAIPKVRIKTIKTSSGEIKRTVTRILPEADDFGRSPQESPAENSVTEEFVKSFPSPEPSTAVETDSCKGLTPAPEASLASPQVDSIVADFPVSGISSASLLTGSSAGAAKAGQQPSKKSQAGAVAQSCNPASLLPKAVHLANLNLVPHSVAASVAAKSSVQRRSQSQLTQMSVPLVHQVKKAAPLVVEAFNKVLHGANPVPAYSPNLHPPLDSSIRVPTSGYCCLECGDSFALEKSLAQHYSRRSVHIEVLCTQCSATLLFLNKCSLLKHARDHKSKGFIMQCSQLLMKPISVDQMFSPSPTSSSAPQAARLPPLPHKPCTPSGPGSSANTQPALPLYTDPLRLIRHGLKCFECNKQALDYIALAAHYQRTSEDNEGLTCQVCQMLLPNRCSYCAHQRIHAHKSPYCCPECGAICRSAYFQTHVKENCLHYSRKVGYRCTHCGVVFMSQAMLKVHIHEKHCEVFHKCSFCPMAFKSADSTTAHITSQHPSEPHKTSQVIYKCSCETVFNKKRLLQEHFQQNANRLMVGVFKCPHCQLVYMQKLQLMQHVKSVHGVPENPEDLTSTRQKAEAATSSSVPPTSKELSVINGTSQSSLSTKDMSPESKPRPKPCTWTCRECSQWIPDRETYVSHMKKSHGKNVKRFPCRQCERSFNASNSLRKHTRNNHDTAKKVYTCWYCTDDVQTFPQPSMLESHISLMHGIKNPDLSQIPKAKAPAEDSAKVMRGAAKSPKRVSAGGLDQREATTSGCEDPPAKRLKAVRWKCAKCGFETATETEFLEHIPRHKTDSSTYQCLLCGLCYTSHISLTRHLFIVHKVKDPEEEEEEEEEEEQEETEQEGRKEGLEMEASENGLVEPDSETNIVAKEGDISKSKDSEADPVSCSTEKANAQNKHAKSPDA